MKDKDFFAIWCNALKVGDRDAFISNRSLSSIFVDSDNGKNMADEIGKIWDVAHMTVRDLCNRADIGQSELSKKFCIPLRTVQNWCGGQNQCPPYIVLMMARLLGII